MDDFIKFIREQGVVGLAIGLAIGLAATDTVRRLVEDIVTPTVGWMLGVFIDNPSGLKSQTWTIIGGENPWVLSWGDALVAIISLFAVAFVIYFAVKKLGLEKLDKKSDEKE